MWTISEATEEEGRGVKPNREKNEPGGGRANIQRKTKPQFLRLKVNARKKFMRKKTKKIFKNSIYLFMREKIKFIRKTHQCKNEV